MSLTGTKGRCEKNGEGIRLLPSLLGICIITISGVKQALQCHHLHRRVIVPELEHSWPFRLLSLHHTNVANLHCWPTHLPTLPGPAPSQQELLKEVEYGKSNYKSKMKKFQMKSDQQFSSTLFLYFILIISTHVHTGTLNNPSECQVLLSPIKSSSVAL